MLTHVVMFRFEDLTDVGPAVALLRGLAGRIPAANSLRVGTNLRASTGAFDVMLVSEHDDADALEAYRVHPEHRRVVAWLDEHPCDRVAFDSMDL
ncbi:MAG: Dabb family protein [Actinomycetes bacterium]